MNNQTNANATNLPTMHNVKLSVKNERTVSLTCDLSALVDLALPAMTAEGAWYGKDGNKSHNICNIPAQKLRVAGLEDVYVDLRVYTKEQAYTARTIRAEQAQAEAEARAKLEAVRPEAEKLAAVLGKSVDEVMTLLASK